MDLGSVVDKLEQFAPPSLAGGWDNVGLLIEPTEKRPISKILLTNDLTEPVMDEALLKKSDMIISYHPPIFQALKRLTCKKWKERIALRCIENKIALYSPHTSWDAVQGGINEWLLQPFGPVASVVPCEKQVDASSISYTIQLPTTSKVVHCSANNLGSTFSGLANVDQKEAKITKHEPHPLPAVGAGRLATLQTPISLNAAVSRIKSHLQLTHIRLALANNATIESSVNSVAVCAGSGASVLQLAAASADLILTGEMSHHEVLDFVHKGVSVVLTDHSNTERGFLVTIRETLENLLLNKVEIIVSEVDRDPLAIM